MRTLSIFAAIFLCVSCVRHHDFKNIEIESLIAICTELKKVNIVGIVPKNNWPKLLSKFGAEQVLAQEDGVYIRIAKNFVEESGVFCSRTDISLVSSDDPSYKELSKDMYTYVIRG